MASGALETVLRRDRAIVAVSLFVLTALAWVYVLWLWATMSIAAPAASMPDMIMASAMKPWTLPNLGFCFAMWAVMMIGMMTPSAAPMILLYARVGRQAPKDGKLFAATGWFAGGYLLAWTGFALIATLAEAALADAALLSPKLASSNPLLTHFLLVGAGLYQLTPVKDLCLSRCQSPLAFLQRHGGFKADVAGSLRLGLWHGFACIGCCWVLMGLLFVGGVMNILWIAGLSALVLLEKLVPGGKFVSRLVGLVLIVAGSIFLYRTGL